MRETQNVTTVRPQTELPPLLKEILPLRLLDAIRHCGAPRAEELRLHRNRCATVSADGKNYATGVSLRDTEMAELLRRMCGGSLYAYDQTIRQGYVTLSGGIRVGVCGTAATEAGTVIGVGGISGLIVRIPQANVPIETAPVLSLLRENAGIGGALVYSPPGIGKTTFLRAAAREAASPAWGWRTVAVDTRGELGAALEGPDLLLDVLVGYPRNVGMEIAVRSLGAQLILCDEIGGTEDAEAVLSACNCGVPLLATAHAAHARDLLSRPAFRKLHRAKAFAYYVGLERAAAGGFRYRFTRWEDLHANA